MYIIIHVLLNVPHMKYNMIKITCMLLLGGNHENQLNYFTYSFQVSRIYI